MATSSLYTVKLTCGAIPPDGQREYYSSLKTYCNQFGTCQKLFIDYLKRKVVVFYPTIEECDVFRASLKVNNKFSLVLSDLPEVSQSKMNGSERVTSVKKCIDINGTSLPIMEDNDSNTYVPVSDAKKSGFYCFDTAEEAKTHVLNELKEYLMVQSAIFFKFRNWSYNGGDVALTVQFKSDAGNRTSSAVTGNAQNVDARIEPKQKLQNHLGHHTQSQLRNENKENFGSGMNSRSHSQTSLVSTGSVKNMTNRQRMEMMAGKGKSPVVQQGSKSPVPSKVEKVEKTFKLPASRKICLENMNPDIEIQMQVLSKTSPVTFIGFMMSDEYLEFDEVLNALQITEQQSSPSCGDLVIVKLSEDRISRAYILNVLNNKFKVAAIEYAQIHEVDKVFALPSNLLSYKEFVCECEASLEFVKSLVIDGGIGAKTRPNNVLVDVASNTNIKCKLWNPEVEPQTPSALSRMPAVEKPKIQPKVEQQIHTTLPTNMLKVSIGEKLNFLGFDQGYLYMRSRSMHTLITTMNKVVQQTKLEKLEKSPVVGQYVLIEIGVEKKEWRRCLVKQVTAEGALVNYVDYFNSEGVVPVASLCNLTSDAIFGPTLLKARLRYFEEKEYSPKAEQFIKECVKKKYDVVYLQGDVIDLKNEESPKDLSQILIDLDLPEIKTLKDLPQVDLQTNQEISIVVLQVNDGRFYFCPIDSASNKLILLFDTLNNTKLEDFDCAVVKDQLVVANYEGDWYRGVVKDVKDTIASVFFIDYGNIADVNFNDIKQVPEAMLKIEAWAVEGTLASDYTNLTETNYLAVITNKQKQLHYIKIIKEEE